MIEPSAGIEVVRDSEGKESSGIMKGWKRSKISLITGDNDGIALHDYKL